MLDLTVKFKLRRLAPNAVKVLAELPSMRMVIAAILAFYAKFMHASIVRGHFCAEGLPCTPPFPNNLRVGSQAGRSTWHVCPRNSGRDLILAGRWASI